MIMEGWFQEAVIKAAARYAVKQAMKQFDCADVYVGAPSTGGDSLEYSVYSKVDGAWLGDTEVHVGDALEQLIEEARERRS